MLAINFIRIFNHLIKPFNLIFSLCIFSNPREYLKVKECFNPVNVMIKKAVSHKALYPEESLPQPDPALKAQTKMLPSLVEKNKELVDEMRTLFNIKEGKYDIIKPFFAYLNF